MNIYCFVFRQRLLLLLGFIIGFRRSSSPGHPAGIRTNILICLRPRLPVFQLPMVIELYSTSAVSELHYLGVGFYATSSSGGAETSRGSFTPPHS